ncbi:OLC1v1018936C1 [Oldenlandia corymbosa var. corymbosa]|uniref:Glycosyltransferase n=1 Tax=Oldenlandia corymbosa var. corymbosa TaxID=529605 RepID=A0AAV1ECX1_OLDCO|nr:OLC1v1018936C1 [Oldenlandia corymbosa var. corymbosa]
MDQSHVLIVTFPAQGHINPALQFAQRLIKMGIRVTFATSVFAINRMTKTSGASPKGLNFAPFSDGYDDGFRPKTIDAKEYMSGVARQGSNALRDAIQSSSENGCPVTCLVYTLLLPWASTVAREFHVPSGLLWIQPATVLGIYYYYFHGYEEEIKKADVSNPTWSVQFPGLPLLKAKELPSFILPSNDPIYSFALPTFKAQIEMLDNEEKPNILVNTFEALEPKALKAIEKYKMIPIGPLAPMDPNDTSFGGDLFKKTKDYREWLDSKDPNSVIYVSFGSLLTLPKKQMEELASGLLKTGRPFLWVIRAKEEGQEEKEEDKLSCMEELEEKGMIVPWCSQLEVLNHHSLGCFLTHCGWNSTLESIVSGAPVVAFPYWTDQGTNAKLIEDVWKTGIRVRPSGQDEEEGGGSIVKSDEIVRCIEMVMDGGENGMTLRKNVKKMKELGREAMEEGGSSEKNLKAFLAEAGKMM